MATPEPVTPAVAVTRDIGVDVTSSTDLPSMLIALRTGAGLSQSGLAAKLGVSRGYVAGIEQRRNAPGLADAIRWCEACGWRLVRVPR